MSWKAAQMERTMVKGSLLRDLQRSGERTLHDGAGVGAGRSERYVQARRSQSRMPRARKRM